MRRNRLAGFGFALAAAGVVLWAAGAFRGERRSSERAEAPEPEPPATARAERGPVPVVEEAVGTVRSRTSVAVAAQVGGRVTSVAAQAGEAVARGAVLVVLDDRELASRLAQARQALAAAEASAEAAAQAKTSAQAIVAQARARRERVRGFLERGAATPEQMEAAEAEFLKAEAAVAAAEASIAAARATVEQARQVVREAEVAHGHTRVPAPLDGVVAERAVEPGDLAWPGRTLLVVHDPKALRLEAQVREGLIARVRPGDGLAVELPARGAVVPGRVAEVVPSADPLTRTFRVRADFDPPEGVHPGMFGRLRIPVGTREAVSVPASAVTRVGQLQLALVRGPRGFERRLVTTGAALEGGRVEILSGLAGGEEVGLPGAGPR